MKYILIILLYLSISSCALRKVKVSNIEISKDSVSQVEIKVLKTDVKIVSDSTNIHISVENNEIIAKPIDSSKVFIFAGKEYKNVILNIKTLKSKNTYANNKKTITAKAVDSTVSVKVRKKEELKAKTKSIDKRINYLIYLYILALIAAAWFIWKDRLSIIKKIYSLIK